MKRLLFLLTSIFMLTATVTSREIYVSPAGTETASGTQTDPMLSIQKAVDLAEPGDIIYLRGGTYYLTKRIKIEKAGSEEAYISMIGYPGERVILDGSRIQVNSVNEFKQARCIYVNHFGDYWHFKNIEFCNAKDNGMKIEGSFTIVENCKFYGNNDTGLQIGMYKDFSIEETKSFPVSGEPQFNPGYRYSRYNKVINCDSWNNYDSQSFGGSDDGGDADGFAAKLFPGPGTEFHGCRAWNNSDDNWDLYMVYHPIVIAECWAWNGGKDAGNVARGNGNGFKLGGGGTSGGAAFAQSVGAHVVRNCVSFNNTNKGYDQNNAYEAMYLFNNVAWGNDYNYRFPTIIPYGTMYLRNNIGFKATTLNHEFLSAGKEGSKVPDTGFNSWTTFDGCDPYKDGNKVNGSNVRAKDYSSQFSDLSIELASAPRENDGSLPVNEFSRLIAHSIFINSGQNVENFIPQTHSPGGQTLPPVSVMYNDGQADMGAFETGNSTTATLSLVSGKASQIVFSGSAIQTTVYKWGGAATGVELTGLSAGLTATKDNTAKTLTISGIPESGGTYTLTTQGGVTNIQLQGTITISAEAPATLTLISGKAVQEVIFTTAIEPQVFEWGGGATDVDFTQLPSGISATKDATARTLTLAGVPLEDGAYSIRTVGGMDGSQVTINCNITRVLPTKVLTGGWYPIQDEYENLPADLKNVVQIHQGSNSSYVTVWNPSYTEGGTVPSGCTAGAINVERNGGAISWTLPNLAELKSNIHFTGSRTLSIEYTIDGNTKTWNSESLSKRTMTGWDMMLAIGLEPVKKPITLRFINNSTSGGIRMYDFYVKTFDTTSSVEKPAAHEQIRMYSTGTTLIVYHDAIATLKIYSLNGQVFSQSYHSQLVSTAGIPTGVYLLEIRTQEGTQIIRKIQVQK